MKQTDYDHRPEGQRWFEWPLTDDGMRMDAGQLLDELHETVTAINKDDGFPLTLLMPRSFGDIIVDREGRTVRAKCMWKQKGQLHHTQLVRDGE